MKPEAGKNKRFLEKDRKVDRAQLFAEIKFHAIAWDCFIFTENAKEANIIIKKDGSVYDDRPLVHRFSKFYMSDYYE